MFNFNRSHYLYFMHLNIFLCGRVHKFHETPTGIHGTINVMNSWLKVTNIYSTLTFFSALLLNNFTTGHNLQQTLTVEHTANFWRILYTRTRLTFHWHQDSSYMTRINVPSTEHGKRWHPWWRAHVTDDIHHRYMLPQTKARHRRMALIPVICIP
jgi:hypothetical protein